MAAYCGIKHNAQARKFLAWADGDGGDELSAVCSSAFVVVRQCREFQVFVCLWCYQRSSAFAGKGVRTGVRVTDGAPREIVDEVRKAPRWRGAGESQTVSVPSPPSPRWFPRQEVVVRTWLWCPCALSLRSIPALYPCALSLRSIPARQPHRCRAMGDQRRTEPPSATCSRYVPLVSYAWPAASESQRVMESPLPLAGSIKSSAPRLPAAALMAGRMLSL